MTEGPNRQDSGAGEASLDVGTTRPSPVDELDTSDPGDATERNFRYQHAYGAILLIAAASRRLPYEAIWCEQHEDILAQRPDGKWDGYQVKTRQRELGDWTLSDDGFRSAMKGFALLESRFSPSIHGLHLVSNTRFLDSQTAHASGRSPVRLVKAIQDAADVMHIEAPYDDALAELAKSTQVEPGHMFSVLRKTRLVHGPERESFDAEIALNHVTDLPGCAALPRSRLCAIRDGLVFRVYKASSLYSDNPARHWCCLSGNDQGPPELAAKRVSVQEALSIVAEVVAESARTPPFRYLPGSSRLDPGTAPTRIRNLERKLVAAGLQSQVDVFRVKMLSEERRLLQLMSLTPEKVRPLLDQLENVVKGEYAEAALPLSQAALPYGPQLLGDVYSRLRTVSHDTPKLVDCEPYESLVGIAALLTGECQLWWGPEFDLEGAA